MSLDAALAYAAAGWPVAPLHVPTPSGCSCADPECGRSRGKHPRTANGLSDASTDPATIRKWWARWPDANVAIVGGVVGWGLDVDLVGEPVLAAWVAEHGDLPRTRVVSTGGGGRHYLFRWTPELDGRVVSRNGYPVRGIDVKATGGYLVAPPSLHLSGRRYEVLVDAPLADCPAWLVEKLVKTPEVIVRAPYVPPTVTPSTDRERLFVSRGLVEACNDIVSAQAQGKSRHDVLHGKARKFGGYVVAGLIDEETVRFELIRAGEASGKSSKEVVRTVDDGLKSGRQAPLRPKLSDLDGPTMGKVEALAWWDAHDELSAGEVAQSIGVRKALLTEWMAERTAERRAVATLPEARPVDERPAVRAELAALLGLLAAHRDALELAELDELTRPDPVEVVDEGPVGRLAQLVAQVEGTPDKRVRAELLYQLLGDRAFVEAMVDEREGDPLVGLADLARLGRGFHGAAKLVDQLEAAIKEGRKARVKAAREALRSQPPTPPSGPPPTGGDEESKPRIVLSTDVEEMVDGSIDALMRMPTLPLYQRGGSLVQPTRDRSPSAVSWDREAPVLRKVRAPRLFEMLSKVADWRSAKPTPTGWDYKPALPSWNALNALLARDEWPFRRVQGITEVPILRPDGSIHTAAGYDEVTGYYHEPPAGLVLPWPRAFTLDAARAAYQGLCEPFADFPFAEPYHMAAAVSALLSMVGRPAVDGPVPLFPFIATTPKSGKTLMVELIHYIATGREIARMAPGETEEEMEKRITAIAMAGFPAVLFDNLTGTFGGSALDAVVQGRVWQGRILGQSEAVTVPMKTVWMVTGNNLGIKGDLAQRVIPVQLAPQDEHPELRSDFRIPDLRRFVRQHRPMLLSAAYTLLRAHAEAGRPCPVGKFGGYDEWNTVIRSALAWAGAPDPYEGVKPLAEIADERRDQVNALFESWYDAFVGEVVYMADLPARLNSDRYIDLVATMKALAVTKAGDIDYQRLAYIMRQAAGRSYGGYRVVRALPKKRGSWGWRVTHITKGSSAAPRPADADDDIPY